MQTNRYYAGIGSRDTPQEIGEIMEKMAVCLSKFFILRSGGAEGADTFFENGCKIGKGKSEIYLPWKGFENNPSLLYEQSQEAVELAKKYHPNYNKLKDGGKKMMARNCYQVLGQDLKTPVEFILCWTPNGKGGGGTGQAIRIAKDLGIPVYDLAKLTTKDENIVIKLLEGKIL